MSEWISDRCKGETCHVAHCGKSAFAKVAEEMFTDDPGGLERHELTAYLCREHYALVMGEVGIEFVNKFRAAKAAQAT